LALREQRVDAPLSYMTIYYKRQKYIGMIEGESYIRVNYFLRPSQQAFANATESQMTLEPSKSVQPLPHMVSIADKDLAFKLQRDSGALEPLSVGRGPKTLIGTRVAFVKRTNMDKKKPDNVSAKHSDK
jgi:hypothetical protein